MNTMHSNPLQELLKRLPVAFRNVKHPGKDIGGCTFYEEYKPLKKENWKESELANVLWQTQFKCFSPKALHYFLPHIIVMVLKERWNLIAEQLLQILSDYDEIWNKSGEQPLHTHFSDDQREVLRDFLVLMPAEFPNLFADNYHKADPRAKKMYWNKQRLERALAYWRA